MPLTYPEGGESVWLVDGAEAEGCGVASGGPAQLDTSLQLQKEKGQQLRKVPL